VEIHIELTHGVRDLIQNEKQDKNNQKLDWTMSIVAMKFEQHVVYCKLIVRDVVVSRRRLQIAFGRIHHLAKMYSCLQSQIEI